MIIHAPANEIYVRAR